MNPKVEYGLTAIRRAIRLLSDAEDELTGANPEHTTRLGALRHGLDLLAEASRILKITGPNGAHRLVIEACGEMIDELGKAEQAETLDQGREDRE